MLVTLTAGYKWHIKYILYQQRGNGNIVRIYTLYKHLPIMYFLYTAEHVQDTVDFEDELSSGNMLLVYTCT